VLALHFGSLRSFLDSKVDALLDVEDIGPKVAGSIVERLADKKFTDEVHQLEEFIEFEGPSKGRKAVLHGKNIVITGQLPIPRDEVKELIESLGGKSANSVSKKTNFVLAGDEAGSKLDKAKALGVEVIDWESFL